MILHKFGVYSSNNFLSGNIMIYSMTAFSRVQRQVGTTTFFWELKSVNHRYLDVSFRLPEAFRFIEINLRNILRGQVHRGKLECQLKFNNSTGDIQTININEGLVNALLKAGMELAKEHELANDLTVSHLLTWPGVVESSPQDMESLSQHTEELFQEAIYELLTARLNEGNVLKDHIKSRLFKINEEIAGAREIVSLISQQSREKLLNKLSNLQLEVNDSRIEQEIAMILTKMDVSEELDRLQSHVDEVLLTLDRDEAVGRRLDFLMQELNREANTLSSKSDSVALTQHAVQMKVLIEQMREQIQNIE
jgi:uncharacterized protein (TIGR00255 family)